MSRLKRNARGAYHADWADGDGRGQVDVDGDSLTWTFVPADHGNGFEDVVRATSQGVDDYRRDGPRVSMPTAAMKALDRHLGIKRSPPSDLDSLARVLDQNGTKQGREAASEIDAYQAWLRKNS